MVSFFPPLIFFLSFSIYLYTALPSVYWRDAPEFQAVGFLLDIAHPAGSPLYAIAAKLFTFIPFGSIGFKITLLSSFCGAWLSVIVYWISVVVLRDLEAERGGERSTLVVYVIAFVASIVFSFSNVLWENSNITEVYTLQNLFTALMICFVIRVWGMRKDFVRQPLKVLPGFLGFFFLFGLSLGAHAILILYLPFFLLVVYFVWLKFTTLNRIKLYFILLFFFILGASVYLYLPIRSAQNPFYDWGDPENYRNLVVHASDRKDSALHFNFPKSVLPNQFRMYFRFYLESFSLTGVVLGLIGLLYLISRRQIGYLLLLVGFFSPPFLFFIRYWGEPSAFLPNFIIYDILMGIGGWSIWVAIWKNVSTYRVKQGFALLFSALICFQVSLLFIDHFKKNDLSGYWMPREMMGKVFNDLTPNSIVISSLTWFMLAYLQQVEGYRPDVSLLSITSFLAPDFFSKMTPTKFPDIVIPEVSPEGRGSAFLNQNIEFHPVYWETNGKEDRLVEQYLIPDGLFFRVDPVPSQVDNGVIRKYLSNLSRQLDFDKVSENREERVFTAEVISGMGTFFMKQGVNEIAAYHFQLVTALVPNDSNYHNSLGVTLTRIGEEDRAEEAFMKSIDLNPTYYLPFFNLGELYRRRNHLEKAEKYYHEALHFHPKYAQALYSLGEIAIKRKQENEAIDYFQKVLQVDSNNEDARKQIDNLLGDIKDDRE